MPFFTTAPAFITNDTRYTAVMSCSGFAGTAMTSASLPFSSAPASIPSSSASTMVALCRAAAGVNPHFTIQDSCCGLVFPCWPTPASLPNAIRTPIRCALRIISGHALPAASAHHLAHPGAVLALPCARRSALLRAVADALADAERRNVVGRVRIDVGVATPAADRVHRGDHARARHCPCVDRLLQPDVDEVESAEVADRREARLQGPARVLGGVLRLLRGPAQDEVEGIPVPAWTTLESE